MRVARMVMRPILAIIAVCSAAAVMAAQSPAPAAPTPKLVDLTAADAQPLLGDWTIAGDSPQGPVTFTLSLKTEADKPVGTISSDMIPATPISAMAKYGQDVLLRYSFDYQGMPVSAVLTLTPGGDTMKAVFDFADGAFTMPATATRKKAS
jgi:hypothetical protein